MFYQVRADLLFTDPDEALDFFHDCELALAKTALINPDLSNVEWSTAELINNNHAQDPHQPCQVISSASTKPEQ